MISIELSARFKRIVRDAGREADVSATLKLMSEGFGKSHAHGGLGVRKLGEHLFACRTALAWQLIFTARKGLLTFDFAGSHDEVQSYLRIKR